MMLTIKKWQGLLAAGALAISMWGCFNPTSIADGSGSGARALGEGTVYTKVAFAGSTGGWGYAEGVGTQAKFNMPEGIVQDARGNIYVADLGNHRIRKIAPDGTVSTFAGTGVAGEQDGPVSTATITSPYDLVFDSNGNLFVLEGSKVIRKITPDGIVSTFAGNPNSGWWIDGTGTAAGFRYPSRIAIDSQNNLYVSDYYKVRKVTPQAVVTTFAGSDQGHQDGPGATAKMGQAEGIAVDGNGNVFVCDVINLVILKIAPNGYVTTFAGSGVRGSTDGQGTAASFQSSWVMTIDKSGNLFVGDTQNGGPDYIRVISPNGMVSTMEGPTAGTRLQAMQPRGILVDKTDDSTIWFCDAIQIFKIAPSSAPTPTPTPTPVQLPSPKGYWKLNGNTGDSSGAGYNGSVAGTSAYLPGVSGDSFSFNGNTYVNIPQYTAFNNMKSFTLEAWVYPTSFRAYNPVISKVDPNRDFVLQLDSKGRVWLHFAINFDHYYHCVSDGVVPLNQWTHLAAVWTGSKWQLFINGVLAKETDCGGAAPSWTGRYLDIGSMDHSDKFSGRIDEVKIFDTALTPVQINSEWTVYKNKF